MKLTIPWLHKLALVSICLFTVMTSLNLGSNYLFDWDEGIYATIGREMYESGNLLTTTWNGDNWFEKPPAIGWVTALGMSLVGPNELGARLLMPLFAGLTLYAIYKLGDKIGGTQLGVTSMAILGYFNLFLSRARSVNTDGMLLAAITWTAWLLASSAPAWTVGVVMGLAIMVKGPAGLLAFLIALPLLIKKPKFFLLNTLLFTLITTLPWHLYAYVAHGQSFLTPYLLEQVVRRATVPIEFHTESRWFYFTFLAKDLGLGVLLVATVGYVLALKAWLAQKSLASTFLILWWSALPLVIFTLAKTRLSWYILPVYPAIALAVGYAITLFTTAKKSQGVVSILVVGMLAQMLWHSYRYVAPSRSPTPLPGLLQIAKELGSRSGDTIAMLVSPSERVAEAILPEDQAISSSFRYGGAPSVVWYSHKQVLYYYNYDDFSRDVRDDATITSLIVSSLDQDKVPVDYAPVIERDGYLGYIRGGAYAQR